MRSIDADALKADFKERNIWNSEIVSAIDNAPTLPDRTEEVLSLQNTIAKLVEGISENARPEGEWINHRNDYGHNIADCSLCGKTMQWHDEDEDGIPRYCWYCGAPMKGVKNE